MPLFPTTFPSKDEFAPTQPILPNLSPSEELHVLLARIAELTRAISVGSSVASSEVFGQDGNGEIFADEFRLNEEDRRTSTMDASADKLEMIQKKILERIDELEKQQKQQNEQMAKTNAEQLAKVQNEISEIGKWVKKQQKEKEQKEKEKKEVEQKEKALLNFGENFWDTGACHEDIEILGNDRLTVRKTGNNSRWRNVFATHPISLKKFSDLIFYFKISIKQKKRNYSISFGFAFKQTNKLDHSIRASSGTYAWESDGEFRINGSGKGPNGKCSFGVGDVVGIGVNLANRQMIFTKNGLCLESSDLINDPSSEVDDLFPFVSLQNFGDEIEPNFGPNFAFDLATL